MKAFTDFSTKELFTILFFLTRFSKYSSVIKLKDDVQAEIKHRFHYN